MKLMKLFSMMFMLTCYIDGGEGGGSNGDSGGDNGGASGGNDNGGESGNGGNNPAGSNSDAGNNELLAGKYKTPEELSAGYLELQTSYSGKDKAHQEELAKFKAPEAYTPKDEWKDADSMSNRILSVIDNVGKEINLSQDGYEALFDGITEMQDRVNKDAMADTIKSIPNFDTRSKNMQDMALKHLRPDQAQAMDALMQSKESFEAVEVLMDKLRTGGSLPAYVNTHTEQTEAELRAEVKSLNPADSSKRKELMAKLNARGNGEGKLV